MWMLGTQSDMRDSELVQESRGKRAAGLVFATLATLASLALSPTVGAHGLEAVPRDPVLLEQYRAGLADYLKGDYAGALEIWRPLAERESENSAAQLFLGFMNAKGMGLASDPSRAAEWYGRSADQDNNLAQIRLGLMYRRGEGVAEDHVQAYLWATLAARQESHIQLIAQALREALAAEMTPAQISEAKLLAETWIETHRQAE